MTASQEEIVKLQEKIEGLEKKLTKSEKIKTILMKRVERSVDSAGDAYAMFENNILLQQHIDKRTKELADVNKKLLSEIQERKSIEKDLEVSRDAAVRALKVKSEFLANMSHEIRTPMNGVLGMAELLAGTNLDGKQRRFVRIVQSSGESLLNLLNDILDFSKIEAGKVKLECIDFRLHQTVENIVESSAGLAENKNLELICIIKPNVPDMIQGDPGRLRQILSNLISNAVKFTEEGEVVIRVALINETDENAFIRFEVKDTGIGIDTKAKKHIFNEFAQEDGSTTRKYGGTGLGLNIAKQLTEMMGGKIEVESEKKKGSSFWFTVNLRKSSIIYTAESRPRVDLQNIRILIVDDNDTNRAILYEQLAGWKMKFTGASNARDALEILRNAALKKAPYEIAIVDMMMPKTDGLMLTQMIKSDPLITDIRLVMLTSIGLRGDAQEARRKGLAAFLSKPVRKSELKNVLSAVMTNSSETDESQLVTRHSIAETKVLIPGKILLAEDTLVNQEVAREMIENSGCHVDIVNNGTQALNAFLKNQYDIILMDCQMPEMDGYQATKEIRNTEKETPENKQKHIPIIALTAHAMKGDKEKCLSSGMDDYLSKPFSMDQMLLILQRWLPRKSCLTKDKRLSCDNSSAIDPVQDLSDVSEKEQTNIPPIQAEKGKQIIDPKALDNIRVLQQPDKPDMVSKIINIYLNESPKLIKTIHQAISDGDTNNMREAAHSLKSSSANVGALSVSNYSKQLEDIGKAGSIENASQLLSEIETGYEEAQTTLAGMIKGNN
ncbi:MAG: response regulator [Desulfobacteraceae bacterium]|nr:response regulator [Desulfobacteraceae bacterium]